MSLLPETGSIKHAVAGDAIRTEVVSRAVQMMELAPRDRFGSAAGAHSVRAVVDIAGINENNSLFQA